MTAQSQGPKVVVTTIPRSGTHLIDSILELMHPMRRLERFGLTAKLRWHPLNVLPFTGEKCLMGIGRPNWVSLAAVEQRVRKLEPWTYGLGQIPYSGAVKGVFDRHGIRMVVSTRDPRAVLISLLHMTMQTKTHFLHERIMQMGSNEQRIRALISGVKSTSGEMRRGIGHQIDLIQGWIDHPDVLRLRFENLVGSRGGGNDVAQAAEIRRMAEFIDMPLDTAGAERIGSAMFGSGKTFRRGSISAWRDELSEGALAALHDELGDRLERMGYGDE